MAKFVLILLLTIPMTIFGEYRVFQYSVRTKIPSPVDRDSYTIVSTLDPVAYTAYHGGDQSIELNILRTWICRGYTGNGQELCTSPEQRITKELAL